MSNMERYTNADLKTCQYLRLMFVLSSFSSYMKMSMLKILHLNNLLLFEICAREICEKFVYKHSETIEYVKN